MIFMWGDGGYPAVQFEYKMTSQKFFYLKGHTVSDMEITIIEKIFSQDPRFKNAKREILQTKIKL